MPTSPAEFRVLSEVGFKDSEQSQMLSPAMWIAYIRQDMEAGATKVLLEARESGTSGICRPDGTLRYGLIEEIIESGIDVQTWSSRRRTRRCKPPSSSGSAPT